MPFHIDKRAGLLAEDYRAKPTQVKEDRFTRVAISVKNVQISDVEYGELVLNAGAPKHFWKGKRDSALAYPHLGVQTLSSTMRSCTVDLWLQDRILTLTDCTITKSRIVLLDARAAVWGFTIQALPTLNELVLALMQTMGQPILIEINCETWGAQKDLLRDREDHDDDKKREPVTGELLPADPQAEQKLAQEHDKSSIQRQIEAHEAKKKKQRGRKKKS